MSDTMQCFNLFLPAITCGMRACCAHIGTFHIHNGVIGYQDPIFILVKFIDKLSSLKLKFNYQY